MSDHTLFCIFLQIEIALLCLAIALHFAGHSRC